ncbi:MAG: hypothetical protein KC776_11540 [Myxococcales bacterium]|nr:hypothetical protein [Myxococcales bacterium]MCB9582278.1 hypothetical protein [Polyangiaceae bacterium]
MTLLANKKMSPELAARVRASVSGRGQSGARLPPRMMALVRAGLFTVIVAGIAWLSWTFRRAQKEIDRQRAELLERVRRESAGVDAESLEPRLRPWLTLFAGRYDGDKVSDALRAPGALEKQLADATIYVRGPVSGFGGGELAESAAHSYEDAFVRCLVKPPKKRTEKELRRRARSRSELDNVLRLHDALVGAAFMNEKWQELVATATSPDELTRLSKQLDKAPLEETRKAAKARLLLVAMDEPGDREKPAELDGERPHQVRVGLVDLASKKVLLKLRRPVDPSWVSPAARAELANGIDSCALALDVREAITTPVASDAR